MNWKFKVPCSCFRKSRPLKKFSAPFFHCIPSRIFTMFIKILDPPLQTLPSHYMRKHEYTPKEKSGGLSQSLLIHDRVCKYTGLHLRQLYSHSKCAEWLPKEYHTKYNENHQIVSNEEDYSDKARCLMSTEYKKKLADVARKVTFSMTCPFSHSCTNESSSLEDGVGKQLAKSFSLSMSAAKTDTYLLYSCDPLGGTTRGLVKPSSDRPC